MDSVLNVFLYWFMFWQQVLVISASFLRKSAFPSIWQFGIVQCSFGEDCNHRHGRELQLIPSCETKHSTIGDDLSKTESKSDLI